MSEPARSPTRFSRRTLGGSVLAGAGLVFGKARADTGAKPLETTAERWARLQPHVEVFGPADDTARPAALLFHGCGGQRDHVRAYGRAAAEAGYRAFAVDSYGPRGWSRGFALSFVCTGAVFRGTERTGDLVAAVWGVSQRPDVDANNLILAGWSHGSWSAMDLMTMRLDRPGQSGLADADPGMLDGVKGLFAAYPYGGVGALSRVRPWARAPRVYGVLGEHDHVTNTRDAERLYEAPRRAGSHVEIWRVNATHAFDDESCGMMMRYDPALAAEAHARFQSFVGETVGAPTAA